jgi:glyoxylase-like metal-dependent hydrolase (beta-lactamase superfamily II)
VDFGDLILVDCGSGDSWGRIKDNLHEAGFDPADLHTLVLTHGHIDHMGAAHEIKNETDCRVVAHQGDRDVIESGDERRSAADWYGIPLAGVRVDHVMSGRAENLEFSLGTLTLLHAPGHTPGSLVGVVDTDDNHRVLFGQDLHGPFVSIFGSDIDVWRNSMRDLLALYADILCEGHYRVFHGEDTVREFIEEQLGLHP